MVLHHIVLTSLLFLLYISFERGLQGLCSLILSAKKFVMLLKTSEAQSFLLDLLIVSITLEMLLVLLLFESVSWCCVLDALAVVPVLPVFWLCELRIALIRSSVALFNVITRTYLCRYTCLWANLKRQCMYRDSRKE